MASEIQPTTTTIPSESTSPPPQPADGRPPPYPSSLRRLYIFLLRRVSSTARKTDRLLVRLAALLSNPTSTDALLCTLSYTLSLLHALLSRLLARRLTSLAASLAKEAGAVLLPGETLVATLPAPRTTHLLAQTVASSKALAAVIGDFRIFVRLWGLAGIYMWARATWNAPVGTGPRTRALTGVAWAQIACCAAFQVLENGAYLASKGALTGAAWAGEEGKLRETKWWIWSSRFWAAHVGLEFVRLWVLWRYADDAEGESGVVDDGEKEGKLIRERREREHWIWWRDLVSNVAYMPMTLHWSVEEERGILSDWGVGLLGAVAGGAMLVDAWRGTA